MRVQVDPAVIPFVDVAQQVLTLHANGLKAAADGITDSDLRKQRRGEYLLYFDAADWFSDLLDKLRFRRYVLDAGMRHPRHRYVGEPPSQPAASASSAQGEPLSAT